MDLSYTGTLAMANVPVNQGFDTFLSNVKPRRALRSRRRSSRPAAAYSPGPVPSSSTPLVLADDVPAPSPYLSQPQFACPPVYYSSPPSPQLSSVPQKAYAGWHSGSQDLDIDEPPVASPARPQIEDSAVESLLLINSSNAGGSLEGEVPGTPADDAKARRSTMWYKVLFARTSEGNWNETLFTVPTTHLTRKAAYRLSPTGDSPQIAPEIPLQLLHISPHAIPAHIADRLCSAMTVPQLLHELDDIFGTQSLTRSEACLASLRSCLQDFIDDGCDLGLVYGYVRRVWRSEDDLEHFRTDVNSWMRADLELRRGALDSDRVVKPRIPPRRVWDLYSNRVLPFYALGALDGEVPHNVWAVSHPWVAPDRRCYVRTPINGNEWPVPLPSSSALDRVRIELLNMGAEYVFLDVLCLRQEDPTSQTHEFQRRKEWRIDVPTIGHVYRHSPEQTTVIYFNGLGLPFDIGAAAFASPLHWFSRVWTLQEVNTRWLLGGLWPAFDRAPGADGQRFLSLLAAALQIVDQEPDVAVLLEAICTRTGCSHEVDRVAALGYLLRCPKLPIYNQDMSAEEAWSLLIEELSDFHRLHLLLRYTLPGKIDAWRPSWAQAMATDSPVLATSLPVSLGRTVFPRHLLKYQSRFAPELGFRHLSDVFYHSALVIKSCVTRAISPVWMRAGELERWYSLSVPAVQTWGIVEGKFIFPVRGTAVFDTSQEIVMVHIMGLNAWVVGQLVGQRRIEGKLAVVVRKITVLVTPSESICHVRITCEDPSVHESYVVYV